MKTEHLYSEEMERSAISKLFQNPDRFVPKVRKADLKAEHFFVPSYRQIFSWVIARHNDGQTFERRILIRDFVRDPLNEAIGDSSDLLGDLFSYRMDRYESYEEIIGRIKADAALRIASVSLSRLSEGLHTETPQSVVRSLSEAIEGISLISRGRAMGKDSEAIEEDFWKDFKERRNGQDRISRPTGIRELDEVCNGGFRNGELIVIGAPTSGGKSVLSLQSCIPSIRDEKKVCIFSLEMGVTEVANRLVSAIGRVHMSEIIRPISITKQIAVNIKKALTVIGQSKIKVWDDSKISMDFIEAQIEENDGADMIVVDYIQLVEGVKSKTDSREQEVARISKHLKQLAKKFNCPVITASQLNDDGRVRESRAIAHDADIVLQIKPDEGIFVAKNRNGQRGIMLPLKMVGEFQRFETQYQH